MAEPYSAGPDLETLRKDLAALITGGVVPSNLAEHGGQLLELKIVTSQLEGLDEDADEDEQEAAYAKAFLQVLEAAVVKKRIPQRKHRRILKYVLPLKKELRGTAIKERRTAAGKNLTDGKKAVTPGTIRTYKEYEPKALDELARVLVEMEAEHRDEMSPEVGS
jgi:hypothetical protein